VSSLHRSGVLVPLFSLPSTRSWGVGEFLDLPVFARWLASAGQAFVQILPITEIPDADTSPYAAMTAMALDPIYISLGMLEDFEALGGEAALGAEDLAALAHVRNARTVDHRAVRALKNRWLRRAYERFVTAEVPAGSARSERFITFMRAEAWWLDDYAIFQALRTRFAHRPWWEWPAPLANRDQEALATARREHRAEIDYRKFVQWVAAEQWAEARRQMRPVQVFGDLPFMISADSPDVWTRPAEFRLDGTVGVPPDAFSETGQDWGLPPWRSDIMATNDYEWMRGRAQRMSALFDGFRLDHLVGLYRTYVRPKDPDVEPFFDPSEESAQVELGERLVTLYQESGAEIVAEDLGTVPDFVRESLQRLDVPGFKVLRWERRWTIDEEPFIDPAEYPESSVATTGTHDTEPLVCWWDTLPAGERAQVIAMPSVQRHLPDATNLRARLLDAVLRALLESPSRLVILPIQDVFGWPDRINTPATVTEENWTWHLPWPVDRLSEIEDARARAAALAAWSAAGGRHLPHLALST
jgi:4-alpha-glucanotransferase